MKRRTVADIINLVGHGTSIGFNEGELKLCNKPDCKGEWYSVIDVSMYGLKMSNGETWELSKLTQEEIDLVYKSCGEVYLSVLQGLQQQIESWN